MTDLGVHPVADLFPMLPDDELADLAADIKERGQLQPIMLDAEGRILDGRNRYAACRLAGVDCWFETYDGDDPDGYALAVNIARRHLTKGQIAMVAAKACKETLQSTRKAAKAVGVSAQRITQANVVLDYTPGVADLVISGAKFLDAAYEEARKVKAAGESAGTQMSELRAAAPDLADLVVEGHLTLSEALGSLRERREDARKSAVSYQTLIYEPVKVLVPLSAGKQQPRDIVTHMADYPRLTAGTTPDDLEIAGQYLISIAQEWRKQ